MKSSVVWNMFNTIAFHECGRLRHLNNKKDNFIKASITLLDEPRRRAVITMTRWSCTDRGVDDYMPNFPITHCPFCGERLGKTPKRKKKLK
ncbi:MAG: hypothetical protein HYT69_02085 [Candidatus Zambryskibacteria bacterium]|nr:hypothetical protein [Candidatus Zambryskibacteria bacterium]